MISPLVINKALRQHLSPALLRHGFDLAKARRAWGWQDGLVLLLNVENVGNAFAKATGWPLHSLQAGLGLWFRNAGDAMPPLDEQGRVRPAMEDCQQRLQLLCTLDQSRLKARLSAGETGRRDDIWWVEDDGGNLYEVVLNIADSFLRQGVPWLKLHAGLN